MYNGSWPGQVPYAGYPVGYPPVVPGYLPTAVPVDPYQQAYYQTPVEQPAILAVNKNGNSFLFLTLLTIWKT